MSAYHTNYIKSIRTIQPKHGSTCSDQSTNQPYQIIPTPRHVAPQRISHSPCFHLKVQCASPRCIHRVHPQGMTTPDRTPIIPPARYSCAHRWSRIFQGPGLDVRLVCCVVFVFYISTYLRIHRPTHTSI